MHLGVTLTWTPVSIFNFTCVLLVIRVTFYLLIPETEWLNWRSGSFCHTYFTECHTCAYQWLPIQYLLLCMVSYWILLLTATTKASFNLLSDVSLFFLLCDHGKWPSSGVLVHVGMSACVVVCVCVVNWLIDSLNENIQQSLDGTYLLTRIERIRQMIKNLPVIFILHFGTTIKITRSSIILHHTQISKFWYILTQAWNEHTKIIDFVVIYREEPQVL